MRVRRTPYFTKITKGLGLGYYRGAVAGSWTARFYLGDTNYVSVAIGAADDTVEADDVKVFDYWRAQEAARQWGERQRLIAAGVIRKGPYTVKDAVADYLAEAAAEQKPSAVKGAKYVFDAWILPELGEVQVEKLTSDQINRWRNRVAMQPKRVRTKKTAKQQATRATPDTEDARRARRATANRILSLLKAALNRAFHADRVISDTAWRRVKPFKRVDEAVIRYLEPAEAQRLAHACPNDFRKLVQAALLTGCRYAELARLTCSDFNASSGTIAIRFSKGKVRHVTLTDEAKTAFQGWTGRRAGSDIVFLRNDGKRWRNSQQKRPIDEASAKAEIVPAVTFHILRHTHGSLLAMNGTPMGVIAAQLGHADTRMAEKHYAHSAPSYIAQTIRNNFPTLNIYEGGDIVPMRKLRA